MKKYSFNPESGHAFIERKIDGKIPSDFLKELRDSHPEMYNVALILPKGCFRDYEVAEFALHREDKTLGTYVTRVNKIIDGIDPNTRESYTGASSSTRKSDVGIVLLNEVAVRLFTGESWAKVNLSGHVETNDYAKLAYWIEAILEPFRHGSRVERLTEFVEVNGELIEVAPPKYAVEFKGIAVEFASEPSDTQVAEARGKIAQKLVLNGDYDMKGLDEVESKKAGGAESWLTSWIESNYTKPEPKPLPKSANAESIESESK